MITRFVSLFTITVLLFMALPTILEAQSGNERKRVSSATAKSDSTGKIIINTQAQRNFTFQSRSHPRITWSFSRIVSDDSFEKEYTFEVEESIKQFTVNISGSCRSGSVTIEIIMPDNKPYSEVTIDEYGNLNWRKSFRITDETKDRVGDWRLKVTSRSATGSFRLNMQAY